MQTFPIRSDGGPLTSLDEYAALIAQHGNLAGLFGMAEQDVQASYKEGLEAYRRGDYRFAAERFTALTFVNPYEGQLHLAAGSALQQLGEHAVALDYFSAAAELMPDDPGCSFRIAQCQLALSNCDEACETLRQCLSLCATHHSRVALYAQAKALMDRLL